MFLSLSELTNELRLYQNELEKIFNAAIKEKKSLKELKILLKELNINKSSKKQIRKLIESLFYYAIREYALIQFIYLKRVDNLSNPFSINLDNSFLRILLKIPNNKDVNTQNNSEFKKIIYEEYNKYINFTNEEILSKVRNPEFDFGFIKINIEDYIGINNILSAICSSKKIYYTYYKSYPMIILMRCEKLYYSGIEFIIIKKEYIRTPLVVTNFSGLNDIQRIMIRCESIEIIFYNVYVYYLMNRDYLEYLDLININSAIENGLIRKVLEAYQITSIEQIIEKKNEIINDFKNGIIFHEIGHYIVDNDKNLISSNIKLYSLLCALVGSEHYIKALKEALADWAPSQPDNKKGTLAYICEISRINKQKAKALSYIYLRDNWFANSGDDVLPYYTDLLSSLFLVYFYNKGEVNFKLLEKDIPKVYNFLKKELLIAAEKLLYFLENYKYVIDRKENKYLSFDMLVEEIINLYNEEYKGKTIKEIMEASSFWSKFLNYSHNHDKRFSEKLKKFLDKEGKAFSLNILKIITKKKKKDCYNSLRDYIYIRYKELNLLNKQINK